MTSEINLEHVGTHKNKSKFVEKVTKNKQSSFILSQDLYYKFKLKCVQEKKTIKNKMFELIQNYLTQ